jgi:hypothetical protein
MGGSKMDIQEIRCGDVNRTNLAQDRIPWQALVNTVIKDGEFFD